MFHFYLIVAGEVAFPDVLELGLGELAAQTLQMICEDNAIEVVELMLHDASQVASHPFIVLLELFVLIGDANASGTLHLLVNARQTEAAFLHHILFCLIILLDIRVDESLDISFVLRKVFADDIKVDDGEPDGESHLRRRKTDAFAAFQRLIHVLDELLQLRIVFVYLLSLLTKHGLTECVYW